jgi:predicted phage terminase large subunit-like protein
MATSANNYDPSLKVLLSDPVATLRELEKLDCEERLAEFIRQAWPVVEPGQPYVHGWHIDALCLHLEAITDGVEIDGEPYNRLLANVPPGMMKSLTVGVFWPAWEWGPRNMPHMRYVCASHSQNLAIRDNLRMRRLVASEWYQSRWGDRVRFTRDQNAKIKFENAATGFREAVAAGSITGARGDRVIIDDPHSVEGAGSDQMRQTTIDWFKEAVPTRLNNPETSAIIVIMQRLHEEDVSGVIIDGDLGYDHLMLPMSFEPDRKCVTALGFEDPRTEEGELLFPERFPPSVVDRDSAVMGSFATAGQFQQRPEPRGGGIIKREHWQLWDDEAALSNRVKAGRYPPFEYVLASLDTAYTEKQANDPSALTIWGVWLDRHDHKQLMLVSAWAERLELNPLVTKIIEWSTKYKVDKVLIEAKASGYSVAQEIRRLNARETWSVELVNPGSADKVARAYSVQGLFESGIVHAPNREWASRVISQCATFPKGKHDDLVDTVTQSLSWLRRTGMLKLTDEQQAAVEDEMLDYKDPAPLYEV